MKKTGMRILLSSRFRTQRGGLGFAHTLGAPSIAKRWVGYSSEARTVFFSVISLRSKEAEKSASRPGLFLRLSQVRKANSLRETSHPSRCDGWGTQFGGEVITTSNQQLGTFFPNRPRDIEGIAGTRITAAEAALHASDLVNCMDVHVQLLQIREGAGQDVGVNNLTENDLA